jgi:hypothetical protein
MKCTFERNDDRIEISKFSEKENMSEEPEGLDEDFEGEDIFNEGESVLIDKEDGTLFIGLFVGFTDQGLITKNTHRMEKIQDRLSPAFRNDFKVGLFKRTVAELRAIAEDEEIALTGLRKKDEIVAEMADVMLARAEAQLEERTEFVVLKRPVLSYLPWHKIDEMRRLSEYLEEMDLQEFSDSLDMFAGIDAVGPDMGSDESKVSGE